MEREFHRWLKQQQTESPFVQVGIGDDAAILKDAAAGKTLGGVVVTTDAVAEGTHFDLASASLEQVGRKALAVNLSDIAAMGAKPFAALLTLMLPRGYSLTEAQTIFQGARQLADHYQTAFIGGDTNLWDGRLVVSVTVLGWDVLSRQNKCPWLISGANVGDRIVVSGEFGGSILGKHLTFEPRVELAEYLASNYRINAATDVSDSLSLDLMLMARASSANAVAKQEEHPGFGVQLDAEKIPISVAACEMAARSNLSKLDHALTDGEDFELILAVSAEELEKIKADPNITTPSMKLTEIGQFIEQPGFWLCDAAGRKPFAPRGYSH